MEWILFSFLSLICLGANSIADKFSSKKAPSILSAVIKSFFMMISCLIIVASFGHFKNILSITTEQWIFIVIAGISTALDWFFYYAAIKRSHLDAFAPMEETSVLFCSNVMFSMFFLSAVTNGGKILNIVLYFLGIASLLVALCIVVFNKKINPVKSKKWLFFAFASAFFYATALLLIKLKISSVPSDVTSLFVTMIVFVISCFACVFTKQFKSIKELTWKDYLMFFIAALCNTGHTIFRYIAISYDNCDPAIVNIIITLNFVIVSFISCLYFKKKEKVILLILISFVCFGMLLNFIAGVI